MTRASAIERIAGRAVAVRGSDIDTDRIIPARFLRAVTFHGLDAHLFEDDRLAGAASGARHPLDDPSHAAAALLFVNANFGCGSSREHAPQAIRRRGFRAIVGESFAEIFFGNALAIGLPCVTVEPAEMGALMRAAEADPLADWTLDLAGRTLSGAGRAVAVGLPESARHALLSGQWDATGMLLEAGGAIDRVEAALPYLNGFRG